MDLRFANWLAQRGKRLPGLNLDFESCLDRVRNITSVQTREDPEHSLAPSVDPLRCRSSSRMPTTSSELTWSTRDDPT